MKTRALPFVAICISAHSASGATATWDGGATTTSGWGQGANWVANAVPVFDNVMDVTYYAPASARLTNFIGVDRTLRSLSFNDDVDAATAIQLSDGGTIARVLTFDADSGNAAINVTSGAAGTITLSDVGSIRLSDPLLVTHDGTANLTISRPITELNAGSTLTKAGSGRLVLSAANTYSGATTVNAGILQCGVLNALGSTAAGTFVNAGGTLDINDKRLPAGENISIAGTGHDGMGALYNTTGNTGDANYIGGNLILTADASIGAPSGVRYGIGSNGTSTTTGLFKLTKIGAGQFDLRGQVTIGDILVSGGNLQMEGLATYNGGYSLTVNSGCEFRSFETVNPLTRSIVLNGGKYSSTGSTAGGDLVTGPITLMGSGLLDSAGGEVTDKVTFSGNIGESAPGATLAIGGTRRVVLSGTNTYTGDTTVGSTVTLQASGSFTSNIAVGSTASLDGEGITTGSVTFANASKLRFDPATTGTGQHFRAADVIVAPGEVVSVIANAAASGSGIVVLHDANGGLDINSFFLENAGRGSLAVGGAGGNSDLIYNFQAANLEWRALENTDWGNDVESANFQNLGTSLPDRFYARDNVDFTNTAAGTVTLLGNTVAGNLTFSNTAGNDYLISPLIGTYSLEAGSISKTSTGNVTIDAPIVGATPITAGGGGTMTFTGANTTTGAVTLNAGTLALNNATNNIGSLAVNGGTLQIGAGGTTGSIPNIAFTNNGSVVVNRSDNLTIGSLMSGSGTFTQAGAGTAILTANNAYTGLTTVSAGTFQLGNNGTTGTIAGDILNNATVEFNRSNDVTHAGAISGSGLVVKRNLNTLTLTGTNAFDGGLHLYNGTTIAADANIGTGAVTMGPGLANVNTFSIAGGTIDNDIVFSPTGTANKIVNIAAGFTDVTLSGTIHLDANGAAGSPGVSRISTNFGTLVIAGKMTGAGTSGYAKRQNGQVVITNATNDYLGGTNIVDTGVLLVDGKVPGNIFFGEAIDAGGTGIMNGTLGGSGIIGGNVKLQAPSKLSPGGTAAAGVHTETTGTLTINGNLEADLIGTGAGRIVLQLGALAGPNDRVNVGGTLSLGAGVIGLTEILVTNTGGIEAGVYTLIDAANVTGTLDPANVTAEIVPGLNGTLSISGNDLILTVATAGNPYDTWATTFPGLTDSSFNVDFEGDGIDTGLEWILGGNPTVNDAAIIRPVVTGSATSGITLAFNREEDSIGVATLKVEYGATLDIWPGNAIIDATSSGPDANGVSVNVNDVPNPDAVTVTIPASNAAGGKLFARLKATMP
jgi:fibronectin-binding autotransporter adhesin